jgi:NAD+ synthase (glutamine-hydrolysing)
MRIALAQTNPIVGDLEGNAAKIRAFVGRGREAGADLVVFPELSVLGYPPKDLLLKWALVERNRKLVEELATECRGVAALIGFADLNEGATGRPLRNSAALCANGRIVSVHHKMLLPTYDVFDEQRYFEPCESPHLARLVGGGGRPMNLGITICEDLWNEERIWGRPIYTQNPIRQLVEAGADVLVNMSASPFWLNKPASRIERFRPQVAEHHKPLLFVNQVGGNDELIFDGSSAAFAADGRVVAQARSFVEDLLLVELDRPESLRMESNLGPDEEVLEALVLGTRDYAAKSGFREAVLGLSGGIDSALTAAIAAEALGPDRVHGVAMPSRYSSGHSTEDAEQHGRWASIIASCRLGDCTTHSRRSCRRTSPVASPT